jgi:hypothetical protein
MFLEKKGIEVYQKSFGAGEFYEKMGKKIIVDFFYCHLMQN